MKERPDHEPHALIRELEDEIFTFLKGVKPGDIRAIAFNDNCVCRETQSTIDQLESDHNEQQEYSRTQIALAQESGDDLEEVVRELQIESLHTNSTYLIAIQRRAIALERYNDRRATVPGYAIETNSIDTLFYDLLAKFETNYGTQNSDSEVTLIMQSVLSTVLSIRPEPEN